MKILVINAGSSSLKYQLIDMTGENVLAKGLCERIGIGGKIIHKTDSGKVEYEADFPTHQQAFEELVRVLTTGEQAVIKDMSEISAVGHRVVQGGDKFAESALISQEMLEGVEAFNDLAPLHNPANIMAIRACMKVFDRSVPQVAVFDTAFHQSIPEKAFIFPIPYEYYEKHRVRRYGFHGTSHRFVSARMYELLGNPRAKIITCHLGNGSSITAIDAGKSVDTTMGFTPLDGIMMGTRSGSIDPSIVTFLQEKEGLSAKEIDSILNKKSGNLGVSGLTSDQRDLNAAAKEGNRRAALALEIQAYQLRKYIGGFAAAMGGLDGIVFTGGIGENDRQVVERSCVNLEFMGVSLGNLGQKGEFEASAPGSRVKVWVIPTDEELLIARDTKEVARL
ncbi:MAG: acetate kinase [Oscillospiraceae bacterium]|jgi:acetate kinase|nr:acetate kinase [Oscillospiraceae bacterium]